MNEINAECINKRNTKSDAWGGGTVLRSPLPRRCRAAGRKASFMRQRVNTGWMGLRHCAFSPWAITPTTLVPKTRLNGVSVRPFTPRIRPSLCSECALRSREHGCVCIWEGGGWVGGRGNRGPLCDGQGGPEPRASACMQKLQRYNRPLTPASQEGIHPMPGEQRAGLVLLTRRGRKVVGGGRFNDF